MGHVHRPLLALNHDMEDKFRSEISRSSDDCSAHIQRSLDSAQSGKPLSGAFIELAGREQLQRPHQLLLNR